MSRARRGRVINTARSNRTVILILSAALLVQFGALAWYAVFFRTHGYLPEPFVYNKFDTFMDMYNPLWWNTSDKYGRWGSVYPPLNFLVLDVIHLVSFGRYGFEDAADMRDASLLPAIIATVAFIAPELRIRPPL